jgi:hypothetical protein
LRRDPVRVGLGRGSGLRVGLFLAGGRAGFIYFGRARGGRVVDARIVRRRVSDLDTLDGGSGTSTGRSTRLEAIGLAGDDGSARSSSAA